MTEGQSLTRAVAVLHAIADKPGSSLGEISKATGLARSTVQRLVSSLNKVGFVTKNFRQQGVYLGMELARLAAHVNLDARKLLMPLMEELHAKIGDNIDLTTVDGCKVVVIEQIASNEDIRVISHVGREHPVNCTANGKAHLGMLAPEEALKLLEGELPRMTKNTITDRVELMAQIDFFRKTGLYVDREEFGEDACAIATSLPQIGGRQFAISIAMPKARFERREQAIRSALLAFRASVSQAFGDSI